MKKNNKMLNQLFTISNLEKMTDNTGIKTVVTLNPMHDIFKGHFPEHPVLPGVCIVHIIKEILQKTYKKDLRLTKSDTIKFKRTVNPLENKILEIDIKIKSNENGISISSLVFSENTEFCSFRGTFVDAEE